MTLSLRITLWVAAAVMTVAADAVTKALPHRVVVFNYSHTPPLVFGVVAVFLALLAFWRSPLIVLGAGFMFGGLCGNAGQLLLFGYATDWIPVGGWLTNMADVAGAMGLLCCSLGYAVTALRIRRRPALTNARRVVPK